MDKLIYIIIAAVAAMVVVAYVWERKECEARGGTMVQDGYVYVWHTTDYKTGAGHMRPVPQYKCEIPK